MNCTTVSNFDGLVPYASLVLDETGDRAFLPLVWTLYTVFIVWLYLAACVFLHCYSKDMSVRRDVGVLGNQSYLTALACLQSCPLLEDLSRWSQWSLVFEPEHGPIKNFLHKYGGVHSETLHVNGEMFM